MSNETRDFRQKVSSSAQGSCHFIWPLMIGAAGHEDATYPFLHFEFRKDERKEDNSAALAALPPRVLVRTSLPARLDDLQL